VYLDYNCGTQQGRNVSGKSHLEYSVKMLLNIALSINIIALLKVVSGEKEGGKKIG